MADETKNPPAQADEPVEVVAAVVGDESGVQAAGAIAVEGDYAVLVAQFADMDSATVAYEALREAEYRRAIDIEVPLPPQLADALRRTKKSTRIAPSFDTWKALLLSKR